MPDQAPEAEARAFAASFRSFLDWIHTADADQRNEVAVLVADLLSVQHAFWVALATLAVLRSSALNTGQNIVRAVLGTTVSGVETLLVRARRSLRKTLDKD